MMDHDTKQLLERALETLRIYAGCSQCVHNTGDVPTHCELGGCNCKGQPDKWEWRGLADAKKTDN